MKNLTAGFLIIALNAVVAVAGRALREAANDNGVGIPTSQPAPRPTQKPFAWATYSPVSSGSNGDNGGKNKEMMAIVLTVFLCAVVIPCCILRRCFPEKWQAIKDSAAEPCFGKKESKQALLENPVESGVSNSSNQQVTITVDRDGNKTYTGTADSIKAIAPSLGLGIDADKRATTEAASTAESDIFSAQNPMTSSNAK